MSVNPLLRFRILPYDSYIVRTGMHSQT